MHFANKQAEACQITDLLKTRKKNILTKIEREKDEKGAKSYVMMSRLSHVFFGSTYIDY